jgi:hypothetical protein
MAATRVLRAAVWAAGPARLTTPPHHVCCSATLMDGARPSLWTGAHDGSIVRWELPPTEEEAAIAEEAKPHHRLNGTGQLKATLYLQGAVDAVSALLVRQTPRNP